MRLGPLYMSEFPFAAGEQAREALPPEIDFLEGLPGVGLQTLEIAARKARMHGVGADEVLIAEGLIGEGDYYRALATRLACPFVARATALAPGFDYRVAMRASVARTAADREAFDWLLAPRGSEVADLLRMTDHGREGRIARGRIAICAPGVFSALVRATARAALAQDASFALSRADASLSANAPKVRWSNYIALGLSAALLLGMATASPGVLQVAPMIMSVFFLGGIYVRLCASAASLVRSQPKPKPLSDFELPTYTILAPMYREAGVAAQFVAALKGLDYPPAKLEIKLVIEDDDRETAVALRRAGLAPNMEIVVAPAGMPRTKPRAMNVALPLARGELLTIFDAEDRPERDQLRVAAAAFAAAGPDVACFQARLVIDNAHESVWAYFFAIGYAALFDALNPGLALLGLPMPLGGTSNHFRTRLLRRVLGWDAWNVTEDADLGLRLARFGYQVGAIDSVTFEDAPLHFAPWLGQRARWMKGWMQTLAVFLGTFSLARTVGSSVGAGFGGKMGAFQASPPSARWSASSPGRCMARFTASA